MKKTIAALTASIIISGSLVPSGLAASYKVKSGDTLSRIAQNNGVTVAQLKEMNKLKTDAIFLGQTLQVPDKKPAAKPAPKPAAPKQTVYTVVKGDSLDKIARKYKTTVSSLKKWNSLENDTIKPGQKLKVTAPAAKPAPKPAVKPAPKPVQPSKTPSVNYEVQPGDSLWLISSKYGVTTAELIQANKLKTESIQAGQKLVIPNPKKAPAAPAKPPAKPTGTQAANIQLAIDEGHKYLGVPYLYGGSTPAGFDCSGFAYYIFSQSGFDIKRTSSANYFSQGRTVAQPQAGDFIFFSPSPGSPSITHMGVYIGDGQFIHADSTRGITITSTEVSYFKTRFLGYKRLF
ncbi:LysM peptidoglycan-binding domain-containing protein [Peribacillus sp. SCS-37]|uniref:C40 family peptidase n=1 Tax=Paraperibacillus esterisolvens TaxID=3115296 RepID=UPI00390663AF